MFPVAIVDVAAVELRRGHVVRGLFVVQATERRRAHTAAPASALAPHLTEQELDISYEKKDAGKTLMRPETF